MWNSLWTNVEYPWSSCLVGKCCIIFISQKGLLSSETSHAYLPALSPSHASTSKLIEGKKNVLANCLFWYFYCHHYIIFSSDSFYQFIRSFIFFLNFVKIMFHLTLGLFLRKYASWLIQAQAIRDYKTNSAYRPFICNEPASWWSNCFSSCITHWEGAADNPMEFE